MRQVAKKKTGLRPVLGTRFISQENDFLEKGRDAKIKIYNLKDRAIFW